MNFFLLAERGAAECQKWTLCPLAPPFHHKACFFNYCLRFLFGSARKPAFGHYRHIQGNAHGGLFLLYPSSMHRHSSRHVEKLQQISCCF
jgi:hypothetical protein